MPKELSQAFGPILEGIDSGFGEKGVCAFFVPEVAYVEQGDKVHFLFGNRELTESFDDNKTIVESFDDLEFVEVVDERTGQNRKVVKDGRWFVEGPYQRSDTRNANGRTYARKIWERILGDPNSPTQQAIKAGGMIGHLEHPKDGRMDANEGALITRSLKLRSDGVVWGVSELMDSPTKGAILQEYMRKGARWGVSSRGNGTVDDTGKVNESDYELVTFDAVLRPSTPGAYPKRVNSGKEGRTSEGAGGPGSLTLEGQTCLNEVADLQAIDVESLDEIASLKFAADLLAQLGRVNSLERSNGLTDEKAHELQDWLLRKLGESQEARGEGVEAEIDRLLTGVTAGDGDDSEQDEAFQRVVSELQTQLSEATEEVESLRAQLEAQAEELERATSSMEALQSEREQFESDLADVKVELEQVRGKLSIAEDVISARSAVEVADAKQKAVEEAIEQVEGLEDFREALEGAADATGVLTLAEQLLPAVAAKRQEERRSVAAPAPVARRALPTVGMIVESDVSGGPQRQATSPSRGARTAGKALAKMGSAKR